MDSRARFTTDIGFYVGIILGHTRSSPYMESMSSGLTRHIDPSKCEGVVQNIIQLGI